MLDGIYKHIGKPQTPFDWRDPEVWIPEILNAADCKLAVRIWRESNRLVNPRHTFGHMYLCKIHKLLSVRDGVFRTTNTGDKFVENDSEVLTKIDEYEGLLLLLQEIAARGPGKRRDLMKSFTSFCLAHTTLRAKSSIDTAHYYAMANLLQRMLIEKHGHIYQVSEAGLGYLRRTRGAHKVNGIIVEQLVKEYNALGRQELAKFLQSMDPYLFEYLIKRLYEKMGYENVEVMPKGQDKGVDVVADIELGISRVREVIQVKRWKDNVGLPIVSLLRGAMPLFDAVRGSIITTGGFSKAAKEIAIVRNAPPITLIDGERLLDLLIEHDIGVRRREIRILEFDAESLSEFASEEEMEAAAMEQPESE